MQEDDGALVQRCLEGDMDAFEALIRRHKSRVCRTLYLLLPNQDDVEDVAQETFIRLYKHLSTFRGDCAFGTWLHRITLNTLRNWVRARPKTLSLDAVPSDIRPASDMGIEAHMVSVEQAMVIRKALSKLPQYYREALVLRHYHDLSYEEIAQIQQVPLGTVRSRIAKGRQILFDRLKSSGIVQAPERTLVP